MHTDLLPSVHTLLTFNWIPGVKQFTLKFYVVTHLRTNFTIEI